MDGRLALGPDGRLAVERPPLPGEADRLRALAGLDVPEVVAVGAELVVTWAPPADRPVAEQAPALAALLAAAHERGICHGPLLPEHLRAGQVDGWAGGTPEDDVAELGRLLLDAGPLPPGVEAVARRAVADDPATRPTMRAVAEALAVPAPSSPTRALRRPVRSLRRGPVLRARRATHEADRGDPVPQLTPGCDAPPPDAEDAPPTTTPGPDIPEGAPVVRFPQWAPAVAAVPIAILALVATETSGSTAPGPPAAATDDSISTTTSSTTSTTLGARPYEGVPRP